MLYHGSSGSIAISILLHTPAFLNVFSVGLQIWHPPIKCGHTRLTMPRMMVRWLVRRTKVGCGEKTKKLKEKSRMESNHKRKTSLTQAVAKNKKERGRLTLVYAHEPIILVLHVLVDVPAASRT